MTPLECLMAARRCFKKAGDDEKYAILYSYILGRFQSTAIECAQQDIIDEVDESLGRWPEAYAARQEGIDYVRAAYDDFDRSRSNGGDNLPKVMQLLEISRR